MESKYWQGYDGISIFVLCWWEMYNNAVTTVNFLAVPPKAEDRAAI